jgi:PAS domain S-box-containing protein
MRSDKILYYPDGKPLPMGISAGPVRREERTLEIMTYIVVATFIIFYTDVVTPLGLTVWILYFIPLTLTMYLQWKYAPFAAAGGFILLMGVSFFLSPRDTSLLFAVLNRVFFSAILVVTALFIWWFGQNVENLRTSEERYRYLTEWSPDAIIVYHEGKILFANPAGLRMSGAGSPDLLIGRDIIDLVQDSQKDLVRERLKQAVLGARMEIPGVRLVRPDGRDLAAEMVLGRVLWDGEPAVQVILRSADT